VSVIIASNKIDLGQDECIEYTVLNISRYLQLIVTDENSEVAVHLTLSDAKKLVNALEGFIRMKEQ